MAKFEIFDTINKLRRAGRPFCVATVVRTADVTSAKAGAKAAITEDGEILGHLGGGCVQGAVRKAAAVALKNGETSMIRVKPSDKVVSMLDTDGVQLFKSGCPSGGTVDLLIETYELPPRLVIFGHSPIAQAIAAQGTVLGYRVAIQDSAEHEGEDVRTFTGADLSPLDLAENDFVVVASQGKGDLAALRAALESRADRVSMVASKRKARVLVDKLIAEGVLADRVARLKAPAGLDLGGIDPQEIGVSVMAEIIQWRNSDKAFQAPHEEDMPM